MIREQKTYFTKPTDIIIDCILKQKNILDRDSKNNPGNGIVNFFNIGLYNQIVGVKFGVNNPFFENIEKEIKQYCDYKKGTDFIFFRSNAPSKPPDIDSYEVRIYFHIVPDEKIKSNFTIEIAELLRSLSSACLGFKISETNDRNDGVVFYFTEKGKNILEKIPSQEVIQDVNNLFTEISDWTNFYLEKNKNPFEGFNIFNPFGKILGWYGKTYGSIPNGFPLGGIMVSPCPYNGSEFSPVRGRIRNYDNNKKDIVFWGETPNEFWSNFIENILNMKLDDRDKLKKKSIEECVVELSSYGWKNKTPPILYPNCEYNQSITPSITYKNNLTELVRTFDKYISNLLSNLYDC
ncbi:MAG: hypothetical protein QW051_03920 [Candidatus Aenigmatarchaeota archaeon]